MGLGPIHRRYHNPLRFTRRPSDFIVVMQNTDMTDTSENGDTGTL
jgi:hypothetical protein